jgi:3-(3-hydroxy-phenyl)propionate hydroxylase
MIMSNASMQHDVAIVGFGPTGVTLANLLGQAGLSVLVIEKEADIFMLPRAIHCDGEVMRVFQSLGLKEPLEKVSRPGRANTFVNAQGEVLMVRNINGDIGPHGCPNANYFHQPDLEAVLRQGISRYQNVKVLSAHEVTQIQEAEGCVHLDVQNLSSGDVQRFSASYVVGCDGGRSLVRKTMGSPMEDLGFHQPWLVFDVLLKDNAPALPLHTVQHCDPERPMTYCNVIGNRRRWEISVLPGDDLTEMARPENLWKLVARWIGPEQADVERAAHYTFHSAIAEGWRKGRLLLAGDAAHLTPPFLGQGLCAGIRDAANLAWKLEAVVRHHAADTLLDTYESERRPHVSVFIKLAVRLGRIIQTTDPAEARKRDERFRNSPEIFDPPSPRLGPGVNVGEHATVGTCFPRLALDNGVPLDFEVGARFTVISTPTVLSKVSEKTRDLWAKAGAAVLPASASSTLADWLERHEVEAVLLRPDHYVMGTASSAAELDALTAHLPLAEILSS